MGKAKSRPIDEVLKEFSDQSRPDDDYSMLSSASNNK